MLQKHQGHQQLHLQPRLQQIQIKMANCGDGSVDASLLELEEKKMDYPPTTPTPIPTSPSSSSSISRTMRRQYSEGSHHHHHHHVQFSPHPQRTNTSHSNYTTPTRVRAQHASPSFHRSLSVGGGVTERTKSWTEQRAPEPFSSPTPKSAKPKLKLVSQQHFNGSASAARGTPAQSGGKKKYGYGNLFRSSSSGMASSSSVRRPGIQNQRGMSETNRTSISSTINGGRSNSSSRTSFRRGNSLGSSNHHHHHRPSMNNNRQPSFSKSDFPLLSPVRKKPEMMKRQESWSAVVGGTEKEEEDVTTISTVPTASAETETENIIAPTATASPNPHEEESFDMDAAGIPPLPLVGTDDITVDEEVLSSEEEEENVLQMMAVTEAPESSSPLLFNINESPSWQERTQRGRSHSFHHTIRTLSNRSLPSPSTHATTTTTTDNENVIFHPFSTFTTISISALHNDIGTLLARSNRVNEAIERYRLSIASAESCLADIVSVQQKKNESTSSSSSSDDGDSSSSEEGRDGLSPYKKCPKVTEAEGLAWFRQKLLRGDVAPAPILPANSNNNGNDIAGIYEGRSTIDGSSCMISSSDEKATTQNKTTAALLLPRPFQPAGFGGVALPSSSPRRMRSASFNVVDLAPRAKQKLSMPLIIGGGTTKSSIEEVVPKSPMMARSSNSNNNNPARLFPCPVTAPQPPRATIHIVQPRTTPQLQFAFARTQSSGSGMTAPNNMQQQQPRTPRLLSRAQSSGSARLLSRARSDLATNSINNTNINNTTTHSMAFHHNHIAPMDDIVHEIHQHQKLDCPVHDHEAVYSCNGLTPLGLEYICDPLPVLGSSLRSGLLLVDSEEDGGRRSKKVMDSAMIESASLVAARLNLASLEYRIAGGGVSEKLKCVLEILESALQDIRKYFKGEFCDCSAGNNDLASTIFRSLEAVVHSNIGAVKYRLRMIREAMTSFEAARAALEENGGGGDDDVGRPFGSAGLDGPHCNHGQSQSEPHDDDRFPPGEYLLLVVRLNLSRVSSRMNETEDASKYCNMISEDNKPHRRNSSRRSLHQGPGRHNFRRSNSFADATSALETSMLAYGHDIDRRSKWLCSVAEHYITGLIHESKDTPSDYKEAWHHYNRLLSLARVKLDHRHAYICAILERRGAVLFEQRKLQQSMLSYLACLKILEHQQKTGSNIFNEADLSRVLYAIARVLHDKEEYHDALHMYQRALACQRALTAVSGRPSLEVITTLCNISRVHHLSGEIDAALNANREVLELTAILVGGKMEHPFLIHRLKVEGNILVEAGRLDDAMRTFVEAARRCDSDDGRDRMMAAMVGEGSSGNGNSSGGNSQEDADAGDSSVLSIRSANALAQMNFFHPAAASA